MGTIVHLIHQVLAKPTIQDITTVTHANNITGYSIGVESKHQHGHCCYCLCMVSNLQDSMNRDNNKMPFVNMSFQQLNSLSSWNWYKDNERYFILQLNVSVKMRVESYFYSEYP